MISYMLLGILGVSLLGNILAGKEINRAGGVIRAGYGNEKGKKKRQNLKNKMNFQCGLFL